MLLKTPQLHSDQAQILLITPDRQLQEQLQAAVSGKGTLSLRMVQATLSAMDQHAEEIKGASVMLVDLDITDPEEVSSLGKIMEGVAEGVPIIAITEALDPDGVREVLKLHVDDWIPKPVAAKPLIEACERAIKSGRATSRIGAATCYSFLPACGGVGATTLAIETAFLLGRKNRSFQSSCLIDLDFQAGAIPDHLDLPPNLNFKELGSSVDRLDQQLLEVMLSRHETGLAMLATENNLLDPMDVDPDIIGQILQLASSEFDTLVIDLPNVWLPFSENALLGSNKVFIITEMTVPGIRRGRALLDVLRERFEGDVDTRVIVNKYDRALFGNTLTKKDAVELFGEHFAGFIQLRQKLVKEAIDRGVPLYEIDRRNKIDKQLSQILFEK